MAPSKGITYKSKNEKKLSHSQLFKKATRTQAVPANFAKYFRIRFVQKTPGRVLLKKQFIY